MLWQVKTHNKFNVVWIHFIFSALRCLYFGGLIEIKLILTQHHWCIHVGGDSPLLIPEITRWSEGESTMSGRAHRALIKVKRCTTDGLLGVKRKCCESVHRFYPHDDKIFLPLLARCAVFVWVCVVYMVQQRWKRTQLYQEAVFHTTKRSVSSMNRK